MKNSLLLEGVSDAVGFVTGALLGYGLGNLLGLDIFAPGYGSASIGGILLVGLGGGWRTPTGAALAQPIRNPK